jgi:glycosyltransferase involved in cell wall biosynthesis
LQLVGRRDVSLVDLAGWGHPLLMAALLFAWLRRIPVTIESDTQLDPAKAAWRRVLKRLLFPVLFHIPRMFFPAGTRQTAYLRRYGVPQARIRIAQMTVDVRSIMSRIDRSVSPVRRDGGIVFMYAGRLESYKGVQDLLDAFMDLQRYGQTAHLVIAGEGRLRAQVETYAGAHSNVRYLGRLSGEELTNSYGQADVLVLPSRSESWGLVVNEAMAAGMPVIATDRVGCVDDLVREGENGYVVPSASAARLSEAMRTFIEQPNTVALMGQKSRQMISTWTIEDEARILVTAWDQLG